MSATTTFLKVNQRDQEVPSHGTIGGEPLSTPIALHLWTADARFGPEDQGKHDDIYER